jgi:hypothetical protein
VLRATQISPSSPNRGIDGCPKSAHPAQQFDARSRRLPGSGLCSWCTHRMFRIVLQPEEQTLLLNIKDGLIPAGLMPGPVLLKLMALRLLRCDKQGYPVLKDLAEAALARMQGQVH